MYICMCVYIYIYMYECMYVCICKHACMHVCMYACMHVCMYALWQPGKGPQGALLPCFSKGVAPWIEPLLVGFLWGGTKGVTLFASFAC